MNNVVPLSRSSSRTRERIDLLLADEDAVLRSLVASRACDAVGGLSVHEAADGAEAVRIGLQQRPQLALLDVNMPRLGGIEVATTLRGLQPQMRLALHSADPDRHRERAREQRLPLFDKLELDRTLDWLEAGARSYTGRPGALQRRSLRCSACGYGIVRAVPPERCPMCHADASWDNAPWRPFAVTSRA